MLIVWICLLVVVIMLLLASALLLSGQKEAKPINERMEKYVLAKPEAKQEALLPRLLLQSDGLTKTVLWCSDRLSNIPKVQQFDLRLVQAGVALRGAEFLVLLLGLMLIVSLLVFLLSRGLLLPSVCAAALTCAGAMVWLQNKIRRRRQLFEDQLGEASAMIANALRSGMSFLQAMAVVSEEMEAPIAEEFSRVIREVRFGVATDAALQHLRQRMISYDLELFVTAVLIQLEVGGNLATIMDQIAANARARLMAGKEMRALTAQGRLSAWVVALMPLVIVFLMSLVNPGYYDELFTSDLGHFCIGFSLVSYVLGLMVVRWIIKVEF